jgi:hypothetical protein
MDEKRREDRQLEYDDAEQDHDQQKFADACQHSEGGR